MSEPTRVDAVAVANAAGSVLTRLVLGIFAGGFLGVVTFAFLALMDILEPGFLRWVVALPLLVVAGSAALATVGVISAVRRAASTLLVDSGVLRRTVERGLARIRAADEKRQRADSNPPPPRGWLATRIHNLGDRLSRVIVERLRSTAAPEAETADTIDQTARALIDEWGEIPQYASLLGYAGLVVMLALLL